MRSGGDGCKSALDEAGGDVDKAVAIIKEHGAMAAAKSAGRETSQGLVDSYIHAGGRIGVLVEVNCETDFVASTEDLQGARARHRDAGRGDESTLVVAPGRSRPP